MAQHPTSASPGSTSSPPDDGGSADLGSAGAPSYAERLGVPWWLWPVGLALAALVSAEVFLGAPGFATWIPYLVLLPGTALALWRLGRLRVAVAGGELLVDDARLPLRYVAQVGVLSAQAKREALVPQADPYAFVVQRPWIKDAVLVVLDYPADPTPYWVVSSRRPAALAAAVQAGIPATG